MTKTAAVEMVVVPCLRDNYAFLVHNSTTQQTALIDAPEAAPIQAVLDARGWTLTDILITHHHDDHIAVQDGDAITVCGQTTHVLDVSGHTVGHIAFHMPDAGFAFTADSLMALGCGRLFEGTPAQMWESMQKLRALPDDTLICSGHEYTESNARFAASLDPDNRDLISRIKGIAAARAAGQATVPSTLTLEKRTNPFLRADLPEFKSVMGMADASAVDVFTKVRALKDRF